MYDFPLVKDRDRLLGLHLKAGLAQLNSQAFLVNSFEESKAHFVVDTIGAGNDFLSQFRMNHRPIPP